MTQIKHKTMAEIQEERRQAAQASRERYNKFVSTTAQQTADSIAQQEAEQATEQAGRQAEAQADLKAAMLSSFLASGGVVDEFEREWPALRAEYVRRQTLANMTPAPTTPSGIAQRELDRMYRQ